MLRLYRSYVFKDKDPVIDQIRTLMSDEDLTVSQVSTLSFVSASTIHNWMHGETRRPQSASVEAVGRAMGYSREWVQMRKDNYRNELGKKSQN
jgi:hypothetical protein